MKDIHIVDKDNRIFSIMCEDYDQDDDEKNNFFNFYEVKRIWLPEETGTPATGIEVNHGVIFFNTNDIKCIVIEDMDRRRK